MEAELSSLYSKSEDPIETVPVETVPAGLLTDAVEIVLPEPSDQYVSPSDQIEVLPAEQVTLGRSGLYQDSGYPSGKHS